MKINIHQCIYITTLTIKISTYNVTIFKITAVEQGMKLNVHEASKGTDLQHVLVGRRGSVGRGWGGEWGGGKITISTTTTTTSNTSSSSSSGSTTTATTSIVL